MVLAQQPWQPSQQPGATYISFTTPSRLLTSPFQVTTPILLMKVRVLFFAWGAGNCARRGRVQLYGKGPAGLGMGSSVPRSCSKMER